MRSYKTLPAGTVKEKEKRLWAARTRFLAPGNLHPPMQGPKEYRQQTTFMPRMAVPRWAGIYSPTL